MVASFLTPIFFKSKNGKNEVFCLKTVLRFLLAYQIILPITIFATISTKEIQYHKTLYKDIVIQQNPCSHLEIR